MVMFFSFTWTFVDNNILAFCIACTHYCLCTMTLRFTYLASGVFLASDWFSFWEIFLASDWFSFWEIFLASDWFSFWGIILASDWFSFGGIFLALLGSHFEGYFLPLIGYSPVSSYCILLILLDADWLDMTELIEPCRE